MERSEAHLKRVLLALALLVGSSCGEGRDVPDTAAVVDSAGVRIIQLSEAAWAGMEVFRLSPSPELSIGAIEGSDDEILFRVSGGAVLEDGRVVILNGGVRELRFYGADGVLTGRQGRTGDGPGEYRQPSDLWTLPGDSVVVWDRRLLRLAVVGPDGTVVRETLVRGRPTAIRVRGVFADGSLVLFQQRGVEEQMSMDQQLMGYYSRLSPLGDSLNALGEFPWMRMITSPPTESAGGMQLVESGPPVFDAETRVAAVGERLWVGTTKRDEILGLNTMGEVKRILRWSGPDRSVTQEVKEAYYAELRERLAANAPPGEVRGPPRGVTFADILPSHRELVARGDGGLWMQEFSRPGAGGANRWRIFGPEALPEGRIELPPTARVLWAGLDRVLLLERDELDVEYVRLYALESGADSR